MSHLRSMNKPSHQQKLKMKRLSRVTRKRIRRKGNFGR